MKETPTALTVTELTRRIKSVLERGFAEVWVQGEISNSKIHTSGHFYFTLKDEGSQLSAVMWRSRVGQLLFRPSDGMKVLVRGNITVYEPRGNYQIDCLQIQPLGVGALQLAFDRLKEKLKAEGLFDESHKRPLPKYPSTIAVVTSPTGAAIHDILTVLQRRFPALEVIVAPVKVQGIGAAEEIAEAIRDLNNLPGIDLMIVGRGGGSLEDLWAFNEETVARAIYASAIPVVSAVGHEVDFSISDFVADLRAPTPSAAAELVVRERGEIIDILRSFSYTVGTAIAARINTGKEQVQSLLKSYSLNRPLDLVRERSQTVDDLERRLRGGILRAMEALRYRAESLGKRAASLDPELILKRGFTIIYRGGKIVPAAVGLSEGDRLSIAFHDGRAESTVVTVHKKPR
ncbi:MAG TPA: exodeoxyribonuclease VII large subunit [Bacteroidota bacterium]|nr:exodeoxyribonuclease VII large subunit [Bacteroidota bacterium]